jgi:ectoine hydroxylase-related dioxygenase (phytanoyl-CoA dioxygenase family)
MVEKHTPTHFLNPFITSNPDEQYFVPDGVGEGSILFWPSPILHYTESNKSDVDRIILSFNLSIQDECGLLN